MLKNSSYVICIFIILALSANAQSFFNLSFESATPAHYPVSWEINEGGAKRTIQVDSTVTYKGRKCLGFYAQNSPMLLAALRFPVQQVRGKTIRISAYLRSDSLQNGTAQLIHYDYWTRKMSLAAETVRGTTPWKEYSYSFSIDAAATGEGIVVGLKVNGTGKVYMDQVSLWLDGKKLTDTPILLQELSVRELAWLNQQAIPVPAVASLSTEITPTQKQRLKQAIGNARIVALGDNSHGSGTIVEIKHQFIKFLVEEPGFSIFALETPAPEAERINQYIQGKEGSKEEVIENLWFRSWQTKEMMELIEWMRSYNQSHKQKIQFKGFDLQSHTVALGNLTRFAQAHDLAMARQLDTITSILSKSPLPDSLRRIAYQKAQALASNFTTHSLLIYSQIKSSDLTLMERDAIILQQNIGLPLFRNRREWMALNISWLEKHAPAGSKMIIWAANEHISKGEEINMGHYLNQYYGQDYLPIGFSFEKGHYSTYGPEKFYPAETSYAGTYEYYLNKARPMAYLLDLRKAKTQQAGKWLLRSLAFRTLGVDAQNHQFKQISLPDHFDLLFFFRESKPTTYLLP